MASCRTPGWACCESRGSDRVVGAGHRRVGRHLSGAVDPCTRARCSPIWPPRWPTARTASTGSGSCCGDREHVFGPVASTTTMWRLVDERIDAAHLAGDPGGASTHARAAGLGGRGGPATMMAGCTSMSMPPSPSTTPTTRKTPPRPGSRRSGITRCWCFWTGLRSPAGKRWPGCCDRATPAVNTAADHITVLDQALESLPAAYRPTRTTLARRRCLVRSDSAGATYGFAAACREAGVGFSLGYRDRHAGCATPWRSSTPAAAGIRRSTPTAASATARGSPKPPTWCDLSSTWPAGTRLILRKERPHPGAQLTVHRLRRARGSPGSSPTHRRRGGARASSAGLELRHRQHARVEDRIRQAKATGLRNLPCHRVRRQRGMARNHHGRNRSGRLDQTASASPTTPTWPSCEIATFRYRVLHVAARITRGARQIRLRIDATWRWATAIRRQPGNALRAAFT